MLISRSQSSPPAGEPYFDLDLDRTAGVIEAAADFFAEAAQGESEELAVAIGFRSGTAAGQMRSTGATMMKKRSKELMHERWWFSEPIPLLYGLGSVNPLRVNLCSNTGMPAAVLPFWQSSIAVNASTSTLRPCAFWT